MDRGVKAWKNRSIRSKKMGSGGVSRGKVEIVKVYKNEE